MATAYGAEWLARTGGVLTWGERGRMVATALTTQGQLLAQLLRRRGSLDELALQTPESALVREAEDAARIQPAPLLGHAYRTSVFARALATIDGADVDHELLHVAGLLHDVGLVDTVTGEDFTRRSGDAAIACADRTDRNESAEAIADAIISHTTIGATVERDGALGAYLQWGAMLDLAGFRERHLPHSFVESAVSEHPQVEFSEYMRNALKSEARAVPGGRFALARQIGFGWNIALARVPTRP